MTIDFGLVLPSGSIGGRVRQDELEAALPALHGPFKSLWMTDHFFWDGDPTYEAWTVIAFMAARWPAWQVGPIVLGQSYRNPALTAKMGATLQALSQGRFIMAIGAGWKEDEYHAYGYPYPSATARLEQLEDALEIIIRMWTELDPVTYHGRHYHVENAYCQPKPDPVPPIMVGGGGRTTIRLAARYADWWNMPDVNYEEYRQRVAILRQHCRDLGRDPDALRLTWFGRLSLARSQDEAIARSNGRWTPDNAFVGTPQQAIEQMRPFLDLGVDYFMLRVLGLPDADVLAMLLDEVLPALQPS